MLGNVIGLYKTEDEALSSLKKIYNETSFILAEMGLARTQSFEAGYSCKPTNRAAPGSKFKDGENYWGEYKANVPLKYHDALLNVYQEMAHVVCNK